MSLAKSIMFVKEKSVGTESHKHNLNMNSLMHNSSQFDKANMSTTINGTTISVQQQFEMSTDVDFLE